MWMRALAAAAVALAAAAGTAQGTGETAAASAPAASSASQVAGKPFPVVVLVSSHGATDVVNILFATALEEQAATELVRRLSALGDWEPVGLRVKRERFVSQLDADRKKAVGELETLVEFGAAGVINHRERWVDLNPFIVGLKQYGWLRVALALANEVKVTGPADFEDNTVRVKCNRRGNSIVYDISIKDPELVSTGVPAHAPSPPARARPRPRPSPSRLPLAVVLIGVVVVAAAGATATALAWRKGLGPWAAKRKAGLPQAVGVSAEVEAGIGREGQSGG